MNFWFLAGIACAAFAGLVAVGAVDHLAWRLLEGRRRQRRRRRRGLIWEARRGA